MQIRSLPIDSLKAYENNARSHSPAQIKEIANSIKEFGFNNPILVDQDHMIIAGHGRLEAAKILGLAEVPTMTLSHLPAAKKKAYILADNRIALNAGWSADKLKVEFEALLAADFDIALTGFTSDEIDTFLNPELLKEGLDDANAQYELPKEPVTKSGDVWLLGVHRVMCGDSTMIDSVEKLMKGEKADMVFTDPPYGIKIVTDTHQVGADFGVAKKGQYVPIIGDETTQTAIDAYALCESLRIPVLIFWGGNYYANKLPPTSCYLIWDKREDSGIVNSFADCEIAWTNIKKPSRIYRQLWNGMIRKGESEKRVHPTQKPIELAVWCFKEYGNLKIILDLFGGSGSTLIACEKTNRKCLMMEISPAYCDVIVRRWEKFSGTHATLESNGLSFDEVANGQASD